MTGDPRPTFLARLARRPFPIFLGLAVGFLACCIAGRVAARQQPHRNFVRFHPFIAPDSHYTPSYTQTLRLAREHARPGKVLVIVGGNSVLHGVGQRKDYIWTRYLQEELGDGFVVLNLAMRAAFPNEFGGVIAERLAADRVPVVYVTLAVEGVHWEWDWDGVIYRGFFWDAWGKGLVPPDPRRDRWLANEFSTRHAEEVLEHRRRGLVDGVTYAQDLWNTVALQYRGTIWTPLKYPRVWRPHREFEDDEAGDTIPYEKRNPASNVQNELKIVRDRFNTPTAEKLLRGDGYDEVGEQFAAHLPDVLRDRTLYLFRMEARPLRDLLPPDERAKYDGATYGYRDAVQRAGLNAEVVGADYVTRDYSDRSHFSEKGGAKMAVEVAPTIRAMSQRLYGSAPAGAGGQP